QAARDFVVNTVDASNGIPFALTYHNVALVRNQGLELEAAVTPLEWVTVRGNFAISSSKPEDLGPIAPRYYLAVGQQILGFPTRTGALTATLSPARRTALSFALAYQGAFYDTDLYAQIRCSQGVTSYCRGDGTSNAAFYYAKLPSGTKLNVAVD